MLSLLLCNAFGPKGMICVKLRETNISGFLHLTMMETQAVAVATRAVGANHLKL